MLQAAPKRESASLMQEGKLNGKLIHGESVLLHSRLPSLTVNIYNGGCHFEDVVVVGLYLVQRLES